MKTKRQGIAEVKGLSRDGGRGKGEEGVWMDGLTKTKAVWKPHGNPLLCKVTLRDFYCCSLGQGLSI